MKVLNKKTKTYYPGVDTIKGVLILLVFAGHIIPGDVREVFPRYLIYSFAMPFFIGISGFLINTSVLEENIFAVIRKYWDRMVMSWAIAVLIYYAINVRLENASFGLKGLISSYLFPWYHLWFVAGFCGYIIVFRLMLKCTLSLDFGKRWTVMLSAGALITLVFDFLLNGFSPENFGAAGKALEWIIYLRPHNFIFLVAGAFIREITEKNSIGVFGKRNQIFGLTVIIMLLAVVLYFVHYPLLEKCFYYFEGILLLLTCVVLCRENKIGMIPVLSFMGKYSLPLYLYHIFCKIVAEMIFAEGSISYYVCSVILFAVLIGVVFGGRNIPWFGRIILGIRKAKMS